MNLFSLGHSDLPINRFVSLLQGAGVTAIADVRTSPWSRRSPWFNQNSLSEELGLSDIEYRFLGDELGGRPRSPVLYRNGVADYAAMAKEPQFAIGIRRIVSGLREHSIALVCSEKDPLHCHRCLLVSRELSGRGVSTVHLDHFGGHETQQEVETRLLVEEGMFHHDDMPLAYRLTQAYEVRRRRVAFSPPGMSQPQSGPPGKWPKQFSQ